MSSYIQEAPYVSYQTLRELLSSFFFQSSSIDRGPEYNASTNTSDRVEATLDGFQAKRAVIRRSMYSSRLCPPSLRCDRGDHKKAKRRRHQLNSQSPSIELEAATKYIDISSNDAVAPDVDVFIDKELSAVIMMKWSTYFERAPPSFRCIRSRNAFNRGVYCNGRII